MCVRVEGEGGGAGCLIDSLRRLAVCGRYGLTALLLISHTHILTHSPSHPPTHPPAQARVEADSTCAQLRTDLGSQQQAAAQLRAELASQQEAAAQHARELASQQEAAAQHARELAAALAEAGELRRQAGEASTRLEAERVRCEGLEKRASQAEQQCGEVRACAPLPTGHMACACWCALPCPPGTCLLACVCWCVRTRCLHECM